MNWIILNQIDNSVIAQALIDIGVDVNATDKEGNTALHKTAKLGNFPSIALCIILFYPIQHIPKYLGNIAVADSLVKAKIGLNTENNHGATPLKLAKSSGMI